MTSKEDLIRKTAALRPFQVRVVDGLARRYGLDFSSALRVIVTQWHAAALLPEARFPVPIVREAGVPEEKDQVVRRSVSLRRQDVDIVDQLADAYGLDFSGALRVIIVQWQTLVSRPASSRDTYLEIMDARTDEVYHTGLGAAFETETEAVARFVQARRLENPAGGFLLDLYVAGNLLDTIVLDEEGVWALVGKDEEIFPTPCYAALDALYHRQIGRDEFRQWLEASCEDADLRARFEAYAARWLGPFQGAGSRQPA